AERLACYYTGTPQNSRELKEYAKGFLAGYMVPDFFIRLDEMPRNKRNKTDYQDLKARRIDDLLKDPQKEGLPEEDARKEEDGPDETERRIRDAFSEVLGLSSVGPEDSFFDLGGNSLLAMQLSLELDDPDLSVKDIFLLKTPRRLAHASRGQAAADPEDKSRAQKRSYPLLPYQRYYVDYQLYFPKGDGSNIPLIESMPRSEISPEVLKQALEKILHHFSVFSTVFTFTDEGFVQRSEPERIGPVTIIETTDEAFEKEILPDLIKPHRVINSLLYRFAIYATQTRVLLYMDFHHSIIDGAGVNLVKRNLIRVLRGEEPEEDLYYDYLGRMELSAKREGQDEALARMKGMYNLPSFDRLPRKDHESRKNGIRILTIPFDYTYSDLTDALSGKNITTGMLYSAAGLLALREYNGSDRVQVQWIYHGRDEKWKENVVGLTMCGLPLAADFGRPGFDLLKEVRSQIAETIPYSGLSFALYDNSPGKLDTVNMICEEGVMTDLTITPGAREIPLWDFRHTSSADVECVLYPSRKEDRLTMFINYNSNCYEEKSVRRFGTLVADCMRRLSLE
ncbi:MAG: hypothetical protein K6F53_10750, partial [Lachnospiraceae bacterium]|nr:hypothetical protein [Lachnospiraceae bacterium]